MSRKKVFLAVLVGGLAVAASRSVPAAEEPTPPIAPAAPSRLWRLRWVVAAGAGLTVVLAGVAGVLTGLRYRNDPPPPSNIDRFWAPVTSSVNPTTFCLGEPAKNLDVGSINSLDTTVSNPKPEPLYFRLHYSGNLQTAYTPGAFG